MKKLYLLGLAAILSIGALPQRAEALSTYYGSMCSGCHGSTPSTCNGCHKHGGTPSGSVSKTTFAPGEAMSFTVNSGTRTGWWRAAVVDGTRVVNTTSVASGTTATVTATAPTTPGTYSWKVAWYGNQYPGASGTTWIADSGNPNHGYWTGTTTTFTVAAPASSTIALNPASLGFGNVDVGAARALTAQVQNTGTAVLDVISIGRCTSPATSAEYTVSPAGAFSVNPGASATVTVTYAPTAAGSDTGCIALTSNASNGPTTNLAVSGAGVVPAAPRIAVSPTALDLGNVTVGASGTATFTISNTGNAPLTGTVARATGTSAEYAVAPASFNVAAGASQVVTVTYAPAAVGADAGSLTVSSNDTTRPTVAVTLAGNGLAAPAPSIALSPAALSFGTVTVGGSAALPVQVRNTGTAPLVVSAVSRCAVPATSAEFTWSPAGSFTVAAGGSTTVTVTYAPADAGADAGCLAFTSNDTARPTVALDLSGTGQAAAAPRIAVSATALSFGNVTVGTSATRTFTITNGGNATLTGTVARASGTSAEYTASPAAFSVPAGGSQVVTVAYAPTAVGADSGALAVASNDPASPSVPVSLTGSGVAAPVPAIALSPASLSFGTVTLGGAGTLSAQLRNTGTAPLAVSGITPCAGTSAEYAFSPAGPLSVAPGATATVSVTYRPVDAGTDSGCLAVASNDPSSAVVNLGLAGTGAAQAIPAIALDPASVDFGTVLVGSSASRTAAIRNTGNGPLTVKSVAPCAGTASAFTAAPAAPFTVAAGASATLTATFKPTAEGALTGCFAIASDDPARPTVELAVAGAGAQPPVPSVDADLDIAELKVPERLGDRREFTPRVRLQNRSAVAGSGSAVLTATLGDAKVYEQSLTVTVPAGGEQSFAFPSYGVTTRRGILRWTLVVTDQDPDVDQATASTVLSKRWSGEADDDDRRYETKTDAASEAPLTQSAGGCSVGGSAGLLSLWGLGLLAARRRRQTKA